MSEELDCLKCKGTGRYRDMILLQEKDCPECTDFLKDFHSPSEEELDHE